MNNLISSIFLAAAVIPAAAWGAESVPYNSDLGSNYNICPDWKNLKGSEKYWDYDRDSDFSTPRTDGGMRHVWENQACDAMLVSPAISLTAGTTYTVSCWFKTQNMSGEYENFKILMGDADDLATMKAGTVLVEKEHYRYDDDFERYHATFTADATADVYFGIYCCSDYYMGTLCATGFYIVEGTEPGGPEATEPEAKELPYQADFTNAKGFKEWTSLAGPDAEVTSPWTFNSYSQFAEFDAADGKKEDNYFISPALKLTEAGSYMVSMEYTAVGSFDLVLGTDAADAASFDRVLFSADDVSVYSEPAEVPFTITTPGEYRVAMRARAEEGSYMGYRLHAFKVKRDLPVPAPVADLRAAADPADALAVDLSWTNPAITNAGAALDAITKVEVYRDGGLLATITDNLTPGASAAYHDEPDRAGVYTYAVVAYNANGAYDGDPVYANAGFVGHPVADFPYYLNVNYASPETLAMFTAEDADGDGIGWEVKTEYYTTSLSSSNGTEDAGNVYADNYLASPYIHLAKGYYRLTSGVSSKNNTFEVGYATNRHDLAGTFVKAGGIEDQQEYGYNDHSAVIPIDTEGDYVLVWRHVGPSTHYAYPSVNLGEITLGEQALLPAAATALTAEAPDFALAVALTWTNPATDNAGRTLEGISKVEVLRDGELIATLTEGNTPGEEGSYTDTLDEGGEYTYSVVVYNENGCAEDEEAPAATIFAGRGKSVPYQADFGEWTVVNRGAYHEWAVAADGTIGFERGYFDDSEYDDGIYSPYIFLEEGKRYFVTFTSFGLSADQSGEFSLQAGTSRDAAADIMAYSHTGTADCSRTLAILPGTTAPLADGDVEQMPVPAGNVVLGFYVRENAAVNIRDFKVEVDNNYSGVDAASAADGVSVSCAGGVVYFGAEVTDVVVADLAGRVLRAVAGATASVDLGDLAPAVLIVRATAADGTVITAKVRR